MPLIQVTSGGQRSLLKKKLQVCESQKSCLFVGDQILIFHHNLQINSVKILQCDFLDFFLLILSLIVEVYLWWKLQASLIFLSGRTCTIGGWLNTFLPHCIYILVVNIILIYMLKTLQIRMLNSHNLFSSGGPLSALTCCVNVRLIGDKKNIAVNLFSKLGWELGLYYASYDDFHPDILARMYT